MSAYQLTSRENSQKLLAQLFESTPSRSASIEVREDKCFGESKWLTLGEIRLKPSTSTEGRDPLDQLLIQAVAHGFFEWHLRTQAELESGILAAVDTKNQIQTKKLKHALIGLAHAIQRLGLQCPVFDAGALCSMPFKRPVTIVADTNAVLQGGLDFTAEFLSPVARLKVPAVVQMEVLTWTDNYFKVRRDSKVKENCGTGLYEHMRSQGAQRALLRLELMMQTELERVRFGADPLRGIVQADKEHGNLGLQTVQRSFADRLIFETALQHLHASSPGHRVILVTSDQGLARMALTEGMEVFFYRAAQLEDVAGKILPGTVFHPFTTRLRSIPLSSVLWEMAVTFGACRLKSEAAAVEICAIGEDLSWTPYHAKEDLLWITTHFNDAGENASAIDSDDKPNRETSGGMAAPPQAGSAESAAPAKSPHVGDAEQHRETRARVSHSDHFPAGIGVQRSPAYRFSPATMLRLVQELASKGSLSNREVMSLFDFAHERKLHDYRGFLGTANLITPDPEQFSKTADLDNLWKGLRGNELRAVADIILRVPSLLQLYNLLTPGVPFNLRNTTPSMAAALPGYRCMLEIFELALDVDGEGLYKTPTVATLDNFVEAAFFIYEKYAEVEGPYIATGLWLEELAKVYGIHPLETRRALERARVQGRLERYVEGSTPDTRFARHRFCMAELTSGEIRIRDVRLFEGDFLLPGKSSVSLRLKRATS